MTLSAYFAVQLPDLTDEQLVKVYTWGKETCVQSNLVMKKEGGFLLIAQKEEARDLRSRQRLMATNLKHWGLDISSQPKHWVRLLTCEQYDAISRPEETARGVADPNEAPAEEAPAMPTLCHAASPALLRLELPPNLLTVRA